MGEPSEKEEVVEHRLERTLFAHTELISVSEIALAQAREQENRPDLLAALVMAAFAFEAYINFLGDNVLSYWKEVDRSPIRTKLIIVCDHLGFQPAFGVRPYQSLQELWKFRNSVAHARTESLASVEEGPPPACIQYPETTWEQRCKLAVAEQWVEDVRTVIRDLHARARLTVGALGMISTQGGEIIRRSPEESP